MLERQAADISAQMEVVRHENDLVVNGLKKMKDKVMYLKARVHHQEL